MEYANIEPGQRVRIAKVQPKWQADGVVVDKQVVNQIERVYVDAVRTSGAKERRIVAPSVLELIDD
jgi:ABC-type dipeptide/oligopeptide/nickel transport system permease subunit